MLNGDGNENSQKKSVGRISKKKNFARAAHFFAHFFAVFFGTTAKEKLPRMPIYRARTRRRTRQFFAFPPFSRPVSPMTINRRIFVAIMEGKLELGFG